MSGLVAADWLEGRLGDPSLVLLEVSSKRPDEAEWFRDHIPGSRYIYWKDLCWDEHERQFPGPETMAGRLGSLGVTDDSEIVLIGDPIQFATYAYWTLTMAGLEGMTVLLDGGRLTWSKQGRPMTTHEPPRLTAGSVTPGPPDVESRLGRDDIVANLKKPHRVLVDLRSDEEYAGERVSPSWLGFDHGAERTGRIPGARHIFFERLLMPDGSFKSPSEIEAEFVSDGATPDLEVALYCRLSHRATLGWFALTRLSNRRDVHVYDGSWTEWGSMVGMPIER